MPLIPASLFQQETILLFKRLLIIFAITLPADSLALKEIPFCPVGGPPGWWNHFVDKDDSRKWHRYRHIPPGYYQHYYYQVYAPPVSYPVYPVQTHPLLNPTVNY